jgi:hypothetical protein
VILGKLISLYVKGDLFKTKQQPGSIDNLPSDFAEAKLLLKESKENISSVAVLLGNFVEACFDAENVPSEAIEFLENQNVIPASSIQVIAAKFVGKAPIPRVTVEAVFDIPLKPEATREALNKYLVRWAYCAIFKWKIDYWGVEGLDLEMFDEDMRYVVTEKFEDVSIDGIVIKGTGPDRGSNIDGEDSCDRVAAPGFAAASRPALFTFNRQLNLELSTDQLTDFCSALSLPSTASLEHLMESSGERDENNESAYQVIDRALLPHLRLDVFFENFSEPRLIFARPENLDMTAAGYEPRLKDCRITYFAVWDLDSEGKVKRVEIALETSIVLDVVDGIDVESPHDCEDADLEDQFRECRNMFNFTIEGFDYDDDEVLEHDWSASFL